MYSFLLGFQSYLRSPGRFGSFNFIFRILGIAEGWNGETKSIPNIPHGIFAQMIQDDTGGQILPVRKKCCLEGYNIPNDKRDHEELDKLTHHHGLLQKGSYVFFYYCMHVPLFLFIFP